MIQSNNDDLDDQLIMLITKTMMVIMIAVFI